MREPLSNSRLGQQEEFFWYSRAPFPLYPFHFDVCFTPSTLLSCSRCFSRFHSVPFSFPQSRFFDYYFFFRPSLPSRCGTRVFPCGDRGRSLFNVPWGELSPEALLPPYLRPSLLSPLPPRLDPAFKRSPTTPSLFSHDPVFRTQSQLPRVQSRELICHISEGENMRHTVMN